MHKTMIADRSYFSSFSLSIKCLMLCHIYLMSITYLHAKVRPSDINYPTDENGLSKGYATPPPAYGLHLLAGYQSTTEPFEQRRLIGLDMNIRASYKGNEIRARWVIFHHTLSNSLMNESAMRSSHLNLDWRWLWGKKNKRTYLSLGVATPMSELSNTTTNPVLLKLDSAQMLAGMLGGLDPWLWTHNSLSGIVKLGWNYLGKGGFKLDIDGAFAQVHQIIDHDALDSFSHTQAKVMLGYENHTMVFQAGGGYAMQIGGTSDDPNQISAHLRMAYKKNTYKYILGGVYNIDPPYGSSGYGFWGLSLGIEYK